MSSEGLVAPKGLVSPEVRAGAEWLDVNEWGWADLIDTERLDMTSPMNCVLGQIESHKAVGLQPGIGFYSYRARKGLGSSWLMTHGFVSIPGRMHDALAAHTLRDEWLEAIRVRTAERANSPEGVSHG